MFNYVIDMGWGVGFSGTRVGEHLSVVSWHAHGVSVNLIYHASDLRRSIIISTKTTKQLYLCRPYKCMLVCPSACLLMNKSRTLGVYECNVFKLYLCIYMITIVVISVLCLYLCMHLCTIGVCMCVFANACIMHVYLFLPSCIVNKYLCLCMN